MIVSKFGGSSMADIPAMKRSAKIGNKHKSKLIIVSATYGTTNQLLETIDLATSGDLDKAITLTNEIKNRHLKLAEEICLQGEPLNNLVSVLDELEHLTKGIYYLKECSPKAKDRIQSIGERLSSILFTKVLQGENPAKNVLTIDARDYLVTDTQHTKAKPNLEKTKAKCENIKNQLNERSELVFVSQGFIGRSTDGDTTTLGRGGSDYSASLFAEALVASEIQIWTDVAGVATTDPRICKEAKIISELSFKEAAEMATFGAKILHPTTMAPAQRAKIPVFVGSSYEPDEPGTWIKPSVDSTPLVRAVTQRKDQALITISNPHMLMAHGFLAKVFQVFEKHDISIDAITTSEISVAMTLNSQDLEVPDLIEDLEKYGKVTVENNLTLISIIGNKINHTPGLASKIFGGLKETNVRMICQGASLHNFCFIVEDKYGNNAVNEMHRTFIG